MSKYYKKNNKRGYLNARVLSDDVQLELQVIDYGGGTKDRNIPTIPDELLQLVIWGVQFPSPSFDPNREIVSATWTGTGQVFDIVRAQEGTEASEHCTGDNIALLFTADMSREILIFEDFEGSPNGSIAYTEDVDGSIEVSALPPDDEVSTVILPSSIKLCDSYVDGIDYQKTVYWIGARHVWFTQTFTPTEDYNITSVILKLYRVGTPGDITISIKATDEDGKPIGLDLCVSTFDGNEITTSIDGEEITFSFDSHSLVTGAKYAIILKSPTNERTYVNWKIDKVDGGYSDGSMYISIDGGVTWTVDFIRRIICGGTVDNSYCGWRIDDNGNVQQELVAGYTDISSASAVCSNGKFYVTKDSILFKFNKDGTLDTAWQTDGSKDGFGTAIRDLALDADENLYVVNSRPASPASDDTIWKLDSNGNVIWSTYPLGLSRATMSVVVGNDGYIYVATYKPTGYTTRGMKLSPVNGAILTYYVYAADAIVVDNFGFVYTVGRHRVTRYANDASSYWYKNVDNWGNLANIFVQSGNVVLDTECFVCGQHETTNKSVWKLDYNLSSIEATYGGYYTYCISEDMDSNLLIGCIPTTPGDDGSYQIIKLDPSDLSFISGIKFNDAGIKHISRQILFDPVGEDGDFYFKIYGFTTVVEKEFKKILVSGGVGEPPYWQFAWADEVGGTKQV